MQIRQTSLFNSATERIQRHTQSQQIVTLSAGNIPGPFEIELADVVHTLELERRLQCDILKYMIYTIYHIPYIIILVKLDVCMFICTLLMVIF